MSLVITIVALVSLVLNCCLIVVVGWMFKQIQELQRSEDDVTSSIIDLWSNLSNLHNTVSKHDTAHTVALDSLSSRLAYDECESIRLKELARSTALLSLAPLCEANVYLYSRAQLRVVRALGINYDAQADDFIDPVIMILTHSITVED